MAKRSRFKWLRRLIFLGGVASLISKYRQKQIDENSAPGRTSSNW